jgi:dihydroorotase-like cyclic amidohydrolase
VQQGARQEFRGAELVISADCVLTPDGARPAAVVVRDGRVVEVRAPDARADVRVPDDCVLLPGLVDTHVHVNEPGRTEWEGFSSATAAAAAGGVTTIVDMPLNSVPPTTALAALRVKQSAAQGGVHIDTAFWGGAVPGNVDALRPLHDAGVVGFKCFLLPSGVEEFPPLDARGLRDAMAAIAGFGGLLIAHARWMCAGPAALAGLTAKGAVAPGFDADFAVFAPDETWVVDPARLRHRHPVTPYAGTTLRGVVRETWLHGTRLDGGAPRGRLLTRTAP